MTLTSLAAEPARSAAAVHGRIAAAEDDHPTADLVGMAEGDVGEPVDADVDVACRLVAAGNVEVAAAGRAGADENRVVTFRQHAGEAVDARPVAGLDAAHAGDVADLLVDHRFGQAEARDLAADHAAAARLGIVEDDVVAERGEVARHGQRGRAGADQRDALAVAGFRRPRQAASDVFLVVGGDALQAADGDGLVLDPSAPAGGLAGPVAGAPEDAGEDIGVPVHHIGVAVAAGGDQANVFRDRRMGWTGPLAVDNLVEIGGVGNVRGRHALPRHPDDCGAASCALQGDFFFGVHASAPIRHSTCRAGNVANSRTQIKRLTKDLIVHLNGRRKTVRQPFQSVASQHFGRSEWRPPSKSCFPSL